MCRRVFPIPIAENSRHYSFNSKLLDQAVAPLVPCCVWGESFLKPGEQLHRAGLVCESKLRQAGAHVICYGVLLEPLRGPKGGIVGKSIGPQLLVEIGEGGRRGIWWRAISSSPRLVSPRRAGHLSSHHSALLVGRDRAGGTPSKEDREDICQLLNSVFLGATNDLPQTHRS